MLCSKGFNLSGKICLCRWLFTTAETSTQRLATRHQSAVHSMSCSSSCSVVQLLLETVATAAQPRHAGCRRYPSSSSLFWPDYDGHAHVPATHTTQTSLFCMFFSKTARFMWCVWRARAHARNLRSQRKIPSQKVRQAKPPTTD
eukprot:scaffold1588_cov133-Skeletonema_menzelii.AAC.5